MTRQEFVENIECWGELINFCYDNGCDYCEDVCDQDEMDSYIDDCIVEMARNADGWKDLYNQLDNIPEGYYYYIHDNDGGWNGADDDDFESYKSDVLDWGDDSGIWDEEDEEYEEDDAEEYVPEEELTHKLEEESDEDDNEIPEEDCSLGELFASGTSKLQTIKLETEQKRKEEEESFYQFITVTV